MPPFVKPVAGLRRLGIGTALALGSLMAAKTAYDRGSDHPIDARAHDSSGAQDRLNEARSTAAWPNRQPAQVERVSDRGWSGTITVNDPGMPNFEQEEAARVAGEERAEQERIANGPILDLNVIRMTGQTEGENLVHTGEIDQFFGHPRAFREEMIRRFGEELRTGGAETNEVGQARLAMQRVLREASDEAREQGNIGRAMNLADLAGDEEGFERLALQTHRPDLVAQNWRNHAQEYGTEDQMGEQFVSNDYDSDTQRAIMHELTPAERETVHANMLDAADDAEDDIQRHTDALNDREFPPSAAARETREQLLQEAREDRAKIQAFLQNHFS